MTEVGPWGCKGGTCIQHLSLLNAIKQDRDRGTGQPINGIQDH